MSFGDIDGFIIKIYNILQTIIIWQTKSVPAKTGKIKIFIILIKRGDSLMAETNGSKKIITVIIAMVVLAALIAGFVIIYNIYSEKPVEGEKNIVVQVILTDGSQTTFNIKTTAEFLRGALDQENLVEGDEGEFGLLVTKVNGLTADSSKQEWWNFTKDGEYLNTGVETTPINDGDQFEITLTVGW